MATMEIMFDDLNPDAQQRVLDFYREGMDDGNWDINPLAILEYERTCGDCGKEMGEDTQYSDFTCKECAKELGLDDVGGE